LPFTLKGFSLKKNSKFHFVRQHVFEIFAIIAVLDHRPRSDVNKV